MSMITYDAYGNVIPYMPGSSGWTSGWPSGAGAGTAPAPAGTAGGVPFMPSGLPGVPSGAAITPTGGNIVTIPQEESYVENILRLNRGKMATVYATYENNSQWNAKVFRGVIEAAGRDHLILSDPSTGIRYLLLMVNVDYVTFDEPINYEYPFQGGIVTQQTPFPTSARDDGYTE
ncbi:MAG: spore coat protein GerQ [Thermobacillus sp. ZCTH02-B1]|uniref:spore coat protein GerQ n=1 Tax=Thermobacillus sp. ZCTH02-B1 TaxID=1858795 RepID=UPI000B57F2DF|nr:spore coat protein GerQ [Thermobacillus sp. ZCTH02-B1]OUM94016.1 MAG: spore coat protein GerQ [Thermobacillus sp. ZCTH02-B1]